VCVGRRERRKHFPRVNLSTKANPYLALGAGCRCRRRHRGAQSFASSVIYLAQKVERERDSLGAHTWTLWSPIPLGWRRGGGRRRRLHGPGFWAAMPALAAAAAKLSLLTFYYPHAALNQYVNYSRLCCFPPAARAANKCIKSERATFFLVPRQGLIGSGGVRQRKQTPKFGAPRSLLCRREKFFSCFCAHTRLHRVVPKQTRFPQVKSSKFMCFCGGICVCDAEKKLCCTKLSKWRVILKSD